MSIHIDLPIPILGKRKVADCIFGASTVLFVFSGAGDDAQDDGVFYDLCLGCAVVEDLEGCGGELREGLFAGYLVGLTVEGCFGYFSALDVKIGGVRSALVPERLINTVGLIILFVLFV